MTSLITWDEFKANYGDHPQFVVAAATGRDGDTIRLEASELTVTDRFSFSWKARLKVLLGAKVFLESTVLCSENPGVVVGKATLIIK